ncbi:C40 family peptidase [Kineococcus gynurae]|uniref:C40 family peptidase n=1 Tax=Kineococcus gynurae TaxID=452979 RepID=UPI0036D3AA3F
MSRAAAAAVVAGGLTVTLAGPAGAAPTVVPATVPAAVPAAVGTAVDAAFGATPVGVISAPAAGATGLATPAAFSAVPTPAPVVARPTVSLSQSAVARAGASRAAAAAPAAEAAGSAAPVAVSSNASGLGERILSIASQYAGIQYVYGGTTPAGFDCSGYTSYVMRQVGIELPRTSRAQRAAAANISRGEAVPGDLVFFSNGGRVFHVGIYAGGNQMWDSPRTGKPVALRSIWSDAVSFGRVAPVA